MLCSDTLSFYYFVHDELQFKRSFQLKIGRYRLYFSNEAKKYVVHSKLIYQLVIQHATYQSNVNLPWSVYQ